VGHRAVHGGPKYSGPQRITTEKIEELHQLQPFDPEHLPEEILLTEAFQRRFPDLVQVTCFDTAFHDDLPRVAQLLPIPRRYEAPGVRRYGKGYERDNKYPATHAACGITKTERNTRLETWSQDGKPSRIIIHPKVFLRINICRGFLSTLGGARLRPGGLDVERKIHAAPMTARALKCILGVSKR